MSISAITLSPRQRRAFGLLVASEIKIAIRRPVGLLIAETGGESILFAQLKIDSRADIAAGVRSRLRELIRAGGLAGGTWVLRRQYRRVHDGVVLNGAVRAA